MGHLVKSTMDLSMTAICLNCLLMPLAVSCRRSVSVFWHRIRMKVMSPPPPDTPRSPREGGSWLSSFSWVRGAASCTGPCSCPWLVLRLVSWMMVKMRHSITKHWVKTTAFVDTAIMPVYLLLVGG